jgi:hypothetical protein
MKRIKVVENLWIYKRWIRDSSKEVTALAKKGPKLPQGPKLEAFTVQLF